MNLLDTYITIYMRPSLLDPLFASLQSLKGIGPRFAVFIAKLCGPLVVDLIWHRPFRVIDRRAAPPIMRAMPGDIVTLEVEVEHIDIGKHGKPSRVRVSNNTGFLDVVYFKAYEATLQKQFPIGEKVVVSGTFDDFNGKKQITHPEYVVPVARRNEIPAVEAVYNLTAGLPSKSLRKSIQLALERAPELPEWIDAGYLKKQNWAAWQKALQTLHNPQSDAECAPQNPARCRLAYDELLANQLALALTREKTRVLKGRSLKSDGTLQKKLLSQLPFALTKSQTEAIKEIGTDMQSGDRMLRMLQGDVGSGKTLVALMAMLQAVEAGAQACLMVPTEILAQQHFASISKMMNGIPVTITLLHGKLNAAAKREALEDMESGKAGIIIGTHAVFQDDVRFHNLGLIVIDEQHRFGVHQRLALSDKGVTPDLLVMTATPIPRTLTLTAYGDMEGSRLTEKPAGRRVIDTRTIPLGRLDEVMEAVARKIKTGEKVYWVCPLVEESELIDLAAATDRYAKMKLHLGEANVALVHGQMKSAEREKEMERFTKGKARLLIATTVIEVGVDVPDATLMVIEHAERFGLAQLHQLRGRVGRNDKPSACLLLFAEPLGEIAKARLKMMRETDDGFKIAEEDLRLRGPGEVLGKRQSGYPDFKLADLAAHGELLQTARDDTKLMINKDPELESERGKALRHLLYLFQYDKAIKTLRSG